MPKAKGDTTGDRLHYFDLLISSVKGLERKGATMPYVSHNGNMFAFIDKSGRLALRLSQEQLEQFIVKYKTTRCEAHGTVLKEYVMVPERLFGDTRRLKPWFGKAFEYARRLKPKSTTRKK